MVAGRRKWVVLIAGVLAILEWQQVFMRHRAWEGTLRSSTYVLNASGGILGWQQDFLYFLYYLNLFPVATVSEEPLERSREGAERIFRTRGDTLVMERFWTIRYGDLLKTYLYLPDAYADGGPVERPLMVLANACAWVFALVALYVAFWREGQAVLGAILVVLLGSNPFQVSEVFARNNVFGWVITTGVLVLALNLGFLADHRPSGLAIGLVPVATGLLLATVRQIRTEPVLVGASVVLAYLAASRLHPVVRSLLVALLAASFTLGSWAWGSYFDAKFREAYVRVKAAGGHPYDGPRHLHHFVWHALWCGLGDFDTRYGYEWNDTKGMAYALPIMRARGFEPTGHPRLERRPFDALTLGVYWDRARQYARTPFEVPEYIDVIREKVVHDITHDPVWYLTILAKRVRRLIVETTPPTVALGNGRKLSLPPSAVWGLLPLGVAAILWRGRGRFLLKLLLFPAPLAATALLIYSGQGTTYYSVMHLVAFAVCVAWLVEAWLGRVIGFAGPPASDTPAVASSRPRPGAAPMRKSEVLRLWSWSA